MERRESSLRDAVHFDFDGDGDQALDLFGGVAGPLGNDLHVGGERSG